MSAEHDVPPTSGMLHRPMARCALCGHWSYLAAIESICLRCSDRRSMETMSGPEPGDNS